MHTAYGEIYTPEYTLVSSKKVSATPEVHFLFESLGAQFISKLYNTAYTQCLEKIYDEIVRPFNETFIGSK